MGYEHKCNSRQSALPYQRERMSKSKTTCFTIVQMPLMIGKDAIFDNKTTCFTIVQMLLMIGKDAIFDNKTTCFTLV